MARKFEKPNIPPDSCDHIDRMIELLENISTEDNEEIRTGYTNIVKEELELVRTINSQLREASKFWHDKYNRRG
tara:strand:- start:3645 stop:3866 length:222 start_codon:yes stop_codon:yes gene_type:complete